MCGRKGVVFLKTVQKEYRNQGPRQKKNIFLNHKVPKNFVMKS